MCACVCEERKGLLTVSENKVSPSLERCWLTSRAQLLETKVTALWLGKGGKAGYRTPTQSSKGLVGGNISIFLSLFGWTRLDTHTQTQYVCLLCLCVHLCPCARLCSCVRVLVSVGVSCVCLQARLGRFFRLYTLILIHFEINKSE